MAGSAGILVQLGCVAVMCMVMAAPYGDAAVSCGLVATNLSPCLGYLRTGGPVPGPCCGGVRSLYSAATTRSDRQVACNCMKSAAAAVTDINLGYASALPGKCGVNIPYKIDPSFDCSKYTYIYLHTLSLPLPKIYY